MEKILPVGSVVLLKNGKKPIAVIGYKMSSPDKTYTVNGQETITNKEETHVLEVVKEESQTEVKENKIEEKKTLDKNKSNKETKNNFLTVNINKIDIDKYLNTCDIGLCISLNIFYPS